VLCEAAAPVSACVKQSFGNVLPGCADWSQRESLRATCFFFALLPLSVLADDDPAIESELEPLPLTPADPLVPLVSAVWTMLLLLDEVPLILLDEPAPLVLLLEFCPLREDLLLSFVGWAGSTPLLAELFVDDGPLVEEEEPLPDRLPEDEEPLLPLVDELPLSEPLLLMLDGELDEVVPVPAEPLEPLMPVLPLEPLLLEPPLAPVDPLLPLVDGELYVELFVCELVSADGDFLFLFMSPRASAEALPSRMTVEKNTGASLRIRSS
jgi:hypothetical protein